jgi:hypothetical protein
MSSNGTTSAPEPYVYRLKAMAKAIDGDIVDFVIGFSLNLRHQVLTYGISSEMVSNSVRQEKKGKLCSRVPQELNTQFT